MRILYNNRSPLEQSEERRIGASWADLDALLSESDFVVAMVPYSQATHHMIGTAQLARMKPTAILVNTARGGIVDSEALRRALISGRIAAAALDVTDPEPLPATHALLEAPNLIVVPHIGSATHTARERMAEMAVGNVLAGLAGEDLPHPAPPS